MQAKAFELKAAESKANLRTTLNVVSLVAVLGIGVVSLNWVRWSSNGVYRSATGLLPGLESKLAADGLSLDPSSLHPKLSASENAATYYLKALALVDEDAASDLYQETPGTKLPQNPSDELHAFLAKNRATLHIIAIGASKQKCDFPIDYSDPSKGIGQLRTFPEIGKVVALKAMVDGNEGRIAEMEADLRELKAMSVHAGQQHCLAGLSASERIKTFALNAMHRLVSQTHAAPAMLSALEKMDIEFGYPDDLAGAMEGELVLANARLVNMRFAKADEISIELSQVSDKALLRNALRARVLERYENLVSIAKQPPQSIVEEVHQMNAVDDIPGDDPTYAACRGIGTKGVAAIGSYQLNHARRMVLLLGIRMLKLKNKTGAFAKTAVLTDPEPYARETFRYERTDDGFWVHCDMGEIGTRVGVDDMVFLYPYHALSGGGGGGPFKPY